MATGRAPGDGKRALRPPCAEAGPGVGLGGPGRLLGQQSTEIRTRGGARTTTRPRDKRGSGRPGQGRRSTRRARPQALRPPGAGSASNAEAATTGPAARRHGDARPHEPAPRRPRAGDGHTRCPSTRGSVTRPWGGRRRSPRRGRTLDTRGLAAPFTRRVRNGHVRDRKRVRGRRGGRRAPTAPLLAPAPPQPQASCSPGPQMQPGPAATHAEASADPRPQALPAAWQDPRGHRVGSRPEGQAQEPVETHIWGRVGHRCPRGACAHGDSRWQGFPRQGRHASHCGRQTKGPAPRRDHRGERWGQAGSWESLAPGRTPASVTQAGPHRGADAPGQAKGLTPR